MSNEVPVAYLWTYDRGEWENSSADTFSVGIFQYLPKSNGKGLKRSKSIRIKGYVSNPDDVYKLATQVSTRLNKEKVCATSLPSWVQKQYSAPKPADRVEVKQEILSSNQVRRVRIQVANNVLIPLGFIQCPNGTYARHRNQQIHVINFQPSKYGQEYFVNLAFSYDFIVPCFQRKLINISMFQLLDSPEHSRLQRFFPTLNQSSFIYGNNVDRLTEQLVDNMEKCLGAFELIETAAANPNAWLDNSLKNNPWRAVNTNYFDAHIALYLNDENKFKEFTAHDPYCEHSKFFDPIFKLTKKKVCWITP